MQEVLVCAARKKTQAAQPGSKEARAAPQVLANGTAARSAPYIRQCVKAFVDPTGCAARFVFCRSTDCPTWQPGSAYTPPDPPPPPPPPPRATLPPAALPDPIAYFKASLCQHAARQRPVSPPLPTPRDSQLPIQTNKTSSPHGITQRSKKKKGCIRADTHLRWLYCT
jgi:hypothetical protein